MRHVVSRQPIFDPDEKVYAYELLASGPLSDLTSDGADGQSEAGELIEKARGQGHSERRIFLDIPVDQIGNDWVRQLPKDRVVLQVSTASGYSDEMKSSCADLKEAGYALAFGDFVLDEPFEPLASMTDILLVDFTVASQSHLRMAPIWTQTKRAKTLAYNVPTKSVFEMAKKIGYHYFHGPFVFEAEFLEKDEVPGFKLNYLRLMQEINAPDLDFNRLEEIIKQDVSLTFKLLKYINSAAFGLRSEIESIGHALNMLGTREVRKWTTLVTMTSMGEDLPEEALVTCVLRGRFLEGLAPMIGLPDRKDDLFFMGIFSMIELFMGRPKEEIIEGIPINEDVKNALLGQAGKFHALLEMALAYEEGDWDPLHAHVNELNLPEEDIPDIYFEAMDWTEKIFMSH